MGIGGISATSLILILLIVLLLFGTKKLRNIGKDLGEGVKGFKNGLADFSEKKEDFSDLNDEARMDIENQPDKVKREDHV